MPSDDAHAPPIPTVTLSPAELADSERRPLEAADYALLQQRALGWSAIAAVVAIVWLVMPVGVGILLGTLLAFALQPAFERLKPRLGAGGSAVAVVSATAVAVSAGLGGLVWLIVAKGTALTQEWIASLGPGGPGGAVLAAVGRLTSRIGIPPEQLASRARSAAESAAAKAASVAESVVSATASSLLALLFMMLSMFFILRNWQLVVLRTQEALPLRPDYTAALLDEFRRVGRTTLLGTVGSGVGQGILAAFGFWITGVPEPLFFGAATAVASLVPGIGATLVWLPVGIALILTGHTGRGILQLAWGAVIVGLVSDYVIRPRLVGGGARLPSLATFAALLGGVQVMGLKGLIAGPVLMSLAFAVLRLYATEARKRRADLARAPAAKPQAAPSGPP